MPVKKGEGANGDRCIGSKGLRISSPDGGCTQTSVRMLDLAGKGRPQAASIVR